MSGRPGLRARPGRLLPLLLLLLGAGAVDASQDGVVVRPIGAAPAPIAALLARGGEGGSLRMAATALPLAYAAERVELLLVVELDGAALLFGHPGGRLGLEFHVYAVSPEGAVRGAVSEGVAIDLRRRGESVERDGIRWTAVLAVPAGETIVRTFVRERHGGEFGLREQVLELAPPEGREPSFVAVAASSPETWLEARSPGLSAEHRAALAAVGGAPTPLPVLPAAGGGRLRAWFGGGPAAPLAGRLVDSRGRETTRLEVGPGAAIANGLGVTVVPFELRLPERVGIYELVLDERGGRKSAPPLRVVVRERPEATSWVRVGRVDLEAASSVLPWPRQTWNVPPSGSERRRIQKELFADWRRWATGERSAAIAARQAFDVALVSNEIELLFDDPRRAVEVLNLVEEPIVQRLLDEERGCLLPLAAFYGDLVAAHLGSGRLALSRRAELIATELLERLASAAREPEERALAAAALESLAAELIAAGAPGRSAALVRRSAELVPDRAASWLAIARLEELAGRAAGVERALERVFELDPVSREGRLRRARLLARAGDAARASAELDRLVAEPVADWVGVVAAQERARARLAASEEAAVADDLEPLVERWPDEPSLWLVLAYASERSGRRELSSAALARALAADRSYSTAPRRRYAEPPLDLLRADRSRVEAEVLRRLDELGRALDAVEAE